MGKSKKKPNNDPNNPDALKEAGNKAFQSGKIEEAIDLYTKAINLSEKTPNHIYFSNRANAYLEKGEF